MKTITLQWVSTLLLLATGLVAVAAAAQPRWDNPFHRAAWRLTGSMFVVFGVDHAVMNTIATTAWVQGPGTPAMDLHFAVSPVLNHSRTFLAAGALVGLVLLSLRKEPPDRRYWRLAWGLMLGGLAFGAMLGILEGPFSISGHLFKVVLSDVVELVALLSTLFVLLMTNRADRMLWGLYSAYACAVALGIFWLSLMSNFGHWWNPPAWSSHAVRNVFYLLMVAAAVFRLSAARRGRTVHGMLGRPVRQLSMIR